MQPASKIAQSDPCHPEFMAFVVVSHIVSGSVCVTNRMSKSDGRSFQGKGNRSSGFLLASSYPHSCSLTRGHQLPSGFLPVAAEWGWKWVFHLVKPSDDYSQGWYPNWKTSKLLSNSVRYRTYNTVVILFCDPQKLWDNKHLFL